MFTKLRIWWLKRHAMSIIVKMNAIYDEYPCGQDLADSLGGRRLDPLRAKKEAIIEKLRKIDPNFPKAKP